METFGANEVGISLDGAGIEPDSVDPEIALRIAASYIALLRKLAEASGTPLALTGLYVRNKCLAVTTFAQDAKLAREISSYAAVVLAGEAKAPLGTIHATRQVRSAIGLLDEGITISAHVEQWTQTVAARPIHQRRWPNERVEFRARVIRIGGKTPQVMLASASEGRVLLNVGHALAKDLAGALYDTIDVEALVARRGDGAHIFSGKLTGYHRVQAEPDAWERWFRDTGSLDAWNAEPSLEGALGRH